MACQSIVAVVWLYVTLLSVLAWGASMECPKWWHLYEEGQLCFMISTMPPLSWQQARDQCKSYGGDLTTIPDAKTNTFVKGLMEATREEYWIGLHDKLTENVFQWLDEDGKTNFTDWAPNEPDNLDDEDCVLISAKNGSQWNDAMCSAHLGYSCQQAAVPATKPIEECPKGWHFYEERKQCFLLDPTPPLSWVQARVMCRFYGGDLTTIPDAKTNTFVKGLMTSSCKEYWIGLHDTVIENSFQWLDEDGETNFTYWAPNEPNNLGEEDCVFISGQNESQWNDARCRAELGYSCQRPSRSNNEIPPPPTTTTTPPPPAAEECPKGWHFYEERKQCFLLDPTPPLSWKKARDMCKSYGGDLTTIPDSTTNTFVKGLLKQSIGDYWIGLHNSVTKKAFQWLDDGGEVNFAHWAPSEPSSPDDENCVFISAQNDGQWNDATCETQLGFSCQRDAKTNFTTRSTTPEPTKMTTKEEVSTTTTTTQQVRCVTSKTTETTTQPSTEPTPKPYVAKDVYYQVTIKTGNRKNAGTDAWVSIIFRGLRGSSRKEILDTHLDIFEQGDTDTITLIALDVGPINSIQISHDNSGDGPGWYIDTITVRRFVHHGDRDLSQITDTYGNTYSVSYEENYFSFYDWIAADEGNGRLYRDVTVTRKSLIMS